MSMQNIMKRSFFVNIILVVIKVVFGVLFGSVALIADGVHSVSDLLSDIFVILGIKHSLKPADDDHPFGHGKFEYVLSFILGISILTIAINLGREIIKQWDEVVKVPSIYALIVVVAVILAKLALARYLIRTGKEIDSEIIYASGKESLTDVISSFVVIFGIGSVLLGNQLNVPILLKGDKIASIIISLFIIKIAVEIIYQAIISLQGKAVRKEISEPFKKIIESVDGVIEVDHMDMVAFGPYYQILVDISIKADITVKEGHDIAKEVSRVLYESEKITHVVVHVNPEGEQ